MKFESVYQSGGNQPFGLADRIRSAGGIHAGEGHDDIGILSGKLDNIIVRRDRPARESLVYGKNHASDIPRAIVFRHLPAPSRRGAAEVLLRCLIGFRSLSFVLDMRVDVDRFQPVHVKTLLIAHGSPCLDWRSSIMKWFRSFRWPDAERAARFCHHIVCFPSHSSTRSAR